MKIVQFISNLSKGGAERLVVDLCNELAENKNLDVWLCVFYEEEGRPSFKNEISEKVKYINLRKKGRISYAFQKKVFSFLKEHRPDVVNSHLSGTILYLYLPVLFFRNIKFFHTVHNLAEEETPGKGLQWLRKRVYRLKKLKPVSISKVTQHSHAVLYGTGSALIYNGVKKQEATDQAVAVRKELESYKLNPDTKLFLSAGRINSPKNQKNFGLLVSVFSRLQHEKINAVLVILGADTSAGQETLNHLKSVKTDAVIFAGQKNNVADYMMASDVFCLSSNFEGLPITIIEAMSHGLPVLSTDVGGVPELVTNGENGLLVKKGDEESYYKAVIELLEWSPEKTEQVKAANKRKYEAGFTIKTCAANYLKAYSNNN